MDYRLMIHPSGNFRRALLRESRKIAQSVYNKKIQGISYRVLTTTHPLNPRKLFLSGEGQVIEANFSPHISVVEKFEAKDEEEREIINLVKISLADFSVFKLFPANIGDYNQNFTLFVELSPKEKVEKIRNKLMKKLSGYLVSPKTVAFIPMSLLSTTTLTRRRLLGQEDC